MPPDLPDFLLPESKYSMQLLVQQLPLFSMPLVDTSRFIQKQTIPIFPSLHAPSLYLILQLWADSPCSTTSHPCQKTRQSVQRPTLVSVTSDPVLTVDLSTGTQFSGGSSSPCAHASCKHHRASITVLFPPQLCPSPNFGTHLFSTTCHSCPKTRQAVQRTNTLPSSLDALFCFCY